jgi:guanylate cyclase
MAATVFRWPAAISNTAGQIVSIGRDSADSTDLALQKRLVVSISLAVLPAAIVWSAIYFLAGAGIAGWIPGSYAVLVLLNTALFAVTRNIGFYRFTQLLMFLLLPWLLMMSLGGFKNSSSVIIWAALCPLGAVVLEDLRRTFLWLLAFIALLVVSAIAQPYLTPVELSETFVTWFFALNLGAVILIGFGVISYFVRQRNFFQERAESLILNILPKDVADALKEEHRTIATQHEAASVLFADIVSFTPMAATLSPRQLVDLLNEVFQCFDGLVEKYDLEKIKTIGDCYMVAAGVPRARPEHAEAIVQLALEMQAEVRSREFCSHRLAFRIGVNSGPVVAGVIGRKKFSYDLWGDAVNLASRMESHGQAGTIQIARNTYELVRHKFRCESNGRVLVKGAGEIETWRVVGPLVVEQSA